jgi:hypothetical protein
LKLFSKQLKKITHKELKMSEEKRIQFVKVSKDDVFFSIMAKKYEGKFFKSGPGYSFPYVNKLAVESEWKRFLDDGIIYTRETSPVQTTTTFSDVGIQTISPPPHLEDAETQTPPSPPPPILKKLSYKYNLPQSFKKHYKPYADLVLSIQ